MWLLLIMPAKSNALMMQNTTDDSTIRTIFEMLALIAGRKIMEIREGGFVAEQKADLSPVTLADQEAERIILDGLRSRLPFIPVVAEEEAAAGLEPQNVGDEFLLVDPLDGTREFVRGGDDFTVNIALVRGEKPVIGVVYAPARNVLYSGAQSMAELASTNSSHEITQRKAISVRQAGEKLAIVASRSHNNAETDAFIANYKDAECVCVGSSLKFCLLATGEADLYPRLGRTMQWDTAAGDAVLRAAGGMVRKLDGTPFPYGPHTTPDDERFANPHFIAAGRP